MIRQQAFTGSGVMLKGALHSHTTRSDGKLEPAELLRIFSENGYDFAAITDHRLYNYENYAPETGIIIIPGMEYNNRKVYSDGYRRTFHTVCIGSDNTGINGFSHDERLDPSDATDQYEYQKSLDEIHKRNNLTIYCHPQWSATPARMFENMQGNFAMEIWNSECATKYDMDNDAAYWDEILSQGKRIFGVAVDDCHNSGTAAKGWVMVNAEPYVDSILEALKEGRFYSSCGPVIKDFYIDDGKIVVDCSEAVKIRLHCEGHPTAIIRAEEELLTHAEFPLESRHGPFPYMRVCVIDRDGKYAWTNPIFIE